MKGREARSTNLLHVLGAVTLVKQLACLLSVEAASLRETLIFKPLFI